MSAAYLPRRVPSSRQLTIRGLNYHLLQWGEPDARPPLVLLHGWMDVAASFQFVADALEDTALAGRWIVAPDWRGFGRSQATGSDCYWFPDYLGDLDALLGAVAPDRPVDLVGHSMGGNVAMSYAGVRPGHVRRLVNLEGFGMPPTVPAQAPKRLTQWLDDLKKPQSLHPYAQLDGVVRRLMKTNPRIGEAKARWLAAQWAESRTGDDGQAHWHILGDAAHKRVNPILYRVDEILEIWRHIGAPLLWVQAAQTDAETWWGGRLTLAEFHQRLDVVPNCRREVVADAGHMLHHDQPEALARLLAEFLAC